MTETETSPAVGITYATLMCHAPIVIPQVARERAGPVEKTTAAMREAARRLVARRPNLVVLVSPHTPRPREGFGLLAGSVVEGNLSKFGASEVHVRFPQPVEMKQDLIQHVIGMGETIQEIQMEELDHGAMVPLTFLAEAGWRGPTLVLSFPRFSSLGQCRRLGHALSHCASAQQQHWALVASGDMSHRLFEGAPGGFHPDAKRFDHHVVTHLEQRGMDSALGVESDLRELAGEDVLESLAVAAGSTARTRVPCEVLNYEGPFGVGYLVAVLEDFVARQRREDAHLLKVARAAIAKAVGAQVESIAEPSEELSTDLSTRAARPVFVTLRNPDDSLRGCIGSLEPTSETLVREVERFAVAAATRDPRFPAVTGDEVADLKVEISVLSEEFPISSLEDQNPRTHGLRVKSGDKTGVLLPDVQGVDTAERQLGICRQKGRIAPSDDVDLFRFTARKIAPSTVRDPVSPSRAPQAAGRPSETVGVA